MNSIYPASDPDCGQPVHKLANPTVLENIDRKIEYHQAEIARLEASKVTMAPLLSLRINDIREAMSY